MIQISEFSEFSFPKIEKATDNFNPSLVIGEGGCRHTFKGILRNTEVSIRMLHPESIQGSSEFKQEVRIN
jgi:hypothetical protein